MKAGPFSAEFRKNFLLQRELFRFSHVLTMQVAQTAACNHFHIVPQRLARWLLMTRDRVRSNSFQMTHEFLALMLGVRRSGVTLAAGSLQSQGLIAYTRGRITVKSPQQLALAACSCYAVLKRSSALR